MKHINYYFLALFLILTKLVDSQSLVFDFNIGYSFGIMPNAVETFNNSKVEDDIYMIQNKKFSQGDGISPNLSLAYFFNENIGIELGFKYLHSRIDSFVEYTEVGSVMSSKTKKIFGSSTSLVPSVAFCNQWKKFELGGNLGVSINFAYQKLDEISIIDTITTIYKWRYDGKPSLGFYSKLFFGYRLNDKSSIDINLTVNHFNFAPATSEIYFISINDTKNNINSLNTIENSIEFVDWVFDEYSQNPDSSKPLQVPQQHFVYSSFFLGVTFRHTLL